MQDPTDHLGAALAGRYALEREPGRGGMATVYPGLRIDVDGGMRAEPGGHARH